jgi:hypothetical protein
MHEGHHTSTPGIAIARNRVQLLDPAHEALFFATVSRAKKRCAVGGLSAVRRRLRLEPFRIHTRFGQFHNVLQLAIDPEFDWETVEIVT